MKYYLCSRDITEAVKSIEKTLSDSKAERQEVIRLSLMFEEVLLNFRTHFGEQQAFSWTAGKKISRIQIVIRLEGQSFDPFSCEESGEIAMIRRLQNGYSGAWGWDYRNGVNIVRFSTSRKARMSTAGKTILSMVFGVLLGVLFTRLPQSIQTPFVDGFLSPTLSTIMGVITAVSGPMIFFSLVWGCCTIGDMDTLSRIGKRMIGRFMLELILISTLSALVCFPFFRGASHQASAFDPAEFYQLLLGIVPNNLLAPFINGNTQQIIFLAIVGGVILLMLGNQVAPLTMMVQHITTAVQTAMTLANKLIPFMVFLSIFKVVVRGEYTAFLQSYKILPVYIGLSLLIILIYTFAAVIRQRVSAVTLFRKAMPAFLLGLTTASSPAAMATTLKSCENEFGIDRKLVSFGVPLGQTLFKPGSLSRFVAVAFCMAEIYGVAITPNWIMLIILTCFLLAVSSPPVAGGAVVCFAVLFAQLGIPEDAIGFALAMNVLFDFILTAVNLYCLQMELTNLSGSLHMLDREVLRRPAKRN